MFGFTRNPSICGCEKSWLLFKHRRKAEGFRVSSKFLLTAATRVVRPTAEQLQVAVALANQAGAGLAAPTDDAER